MEQSLFKWKLHDSETVKELRAADVGKEWMSPTFRMGGFTWYMKLYPNGNGEPHKGYVAIYLYLAVLPPKLKSVSTRYTIEIPEAEAGNTGAKPFNGDHDNWGWGQITLPTEDFKKCEQITVTVKMDILGVFDRDEKDITDEHMARHVTAGPLAMMPGRSGNELKYTWKVTDPEVLRKMKNCRCGQQWTSPVFRGSGFTWFLHLYPNGNNEQQEGYVQQFLTLTVLPPSIDRFTSRWNIRLKEADLEGGSIKSFVKDGDNWGWGRTLMKYSEFQKYDAFTWEATVETIAVFDKDGNDVTQHYLDGTMASIPRALPGAASSSSSGDAAPSSSDSAQLNEVKLNSLVSLFQQMNARLSELEEKVG